LVDHTLKLQGATPSSETNFNEWTEAELRTFLDHHGEDFDDCFDHAALVHRAAECEANTGTPAVRPTNATKPSLGQNDDSTLKDGDDEVDPLDAFMAEMKAMEAVGTVTCPLLPQEKNAGTRAGAEIIETEDHVADYVEIMKKRRKADSHDSYVVAKQALVGGSIAREGNSGEPGNGGARAVHDDTVLSSGLDDDHHDPTALYPDFLKRDIESLEALDHTKIEYEEFNSHFYDPSPELARLGRGEVLQRRRALDLRVISNNNSDNIPAPVQYFEQCGFDSLLLQSIAKAGYVTPTPIQAQAIPVILSGHDVLVSQSHHFSCRSRMDYLGFVGFRVHGDGPIILLFLSVLFILL